MTFNDSQDLKQQILMAAAGNQNYLPQLGSSSKKKKAAKIIELDLQSVNSQLSTVQRNRGLVQDSEREISIQNDLESINHFMPRDESSANVEVVTKSGIQKSQHGTAE